MTLTKTQWEEFVQFITNINGAAGYCGNEHLSIKADKMKETADYFKVSLEEFSKYKSITRENG